MRYSETTCEIVQPDNTTKLVSHAWLPSRKPRAVLVALHGGMAYGGDWMETALYFKSRGMATYALDLRWHGDFPQHNAGEKNFFHIDSYDTYARDIDWYLRKVRLQHRDTPLFLLSHSNGALISLYYGLTIGRTSGIAGAVLSSPWLVNRVKVSPVLKAMARLIAAMHPRFEVTPKPVTDHLTHDPEITARHHEDEKTGLRGTTASAGLAVASEKAQTFVLENIAQWDTSPILGIIAGQDMLADPERSMKALKSITLQPVELMYYQDNYHENFNEINRTQVWEKTLNWIACRIEEHVIADAESAHRP